MDYIIKIPHTEKPYVIVDKRPIENKELSFKAKGLLVYLLGRPPNWMAHLKHLATVGTDGIESVKSAIKELKQAGHIQITEDKNDAGQVVSRGYLVYELPQAGNTLGAPTEVKTPSVKTSRGKTRSIVSKEEIKKENKDRTYPRIPEEEVLY